MCSIKRITLTRAEPRSLSTELNMDFIHRSVSNRRKAAVIPSNLGLAHSPGGEFQARRKPWMS